MDFDKRVCEEKQAITHVFLLGVMVGRVKSENITTTGNPLS